MSNAKNDSRRALRRRSARLLALAIVAAAASTAALSQNRFDEPISRQPSRPAAAPPAPGSPASGGARSQPRADAPASPSAPGSARFASAAAMESRDFGVAPTARLHAGPMHGRTPTTIPGGLVVATEALAALLEQGRALVFDVLGGPAGLPGAQNALGAAQAGSFDDSTQREFGQYLQQVTRGDKAAPLVFYCQSVECWMSYNAALRAINLGYTQVLWYRGGIEAWQAAGLPTQPRM